LDTFGDSATRLSNEQLQTHKLFNRSNPSDSIRGRVHQDPAGTGRASAGEHTLAPAKHNFGQGKRDREHNFSRDRESMTSVGTGETELQLGPGKHNFS